MLGDGSVSADRNERCSNEVSVISSGESLVFEIFWRKESKQSESVGRQQSQERIGAFTE